MNKKANTILPSVDGYPVIGHIISWTIRDFEMTLQDADDLLDAHDIPKDVRSKTSEKSAATRAVRETAKKTKDRFHKKVKDSDVAAFAIVDTEVDESQMDVDFATETTVVFDKESKTLKTSGASGRKVKELYDHYKGMFTGHQFRATMLRYLRRYCAASTLRDGGGIYFIPSTHQAAFESLVGVFDALEAAGCDITPIPIIDTEQAKKSMWKTFVGEVATEIQRFSDDVDKTDDMTERMMEGRMNKYTALKEKVDIYETLLQGTADELRDDITKLTKKLQKKLTE